MTLLNSFPDSNDGLQNRLQNPILDVRRPVLKVVGLGGGGCNAVERMMALEIRNVEFIAANTDRQALARCSAPTRILLGPDRCHGGGAGGNPQVGHEAAEESRAELARAMAGADMVFLTAGMGGGTGTGSIPVAAEIANAQGAVVAAIVTIPFNFEAGRRMQNAMEGLAALRKHTHTLVTISNERLVNVAEKKMPIEMTFRYGDDALRQAVEGITELITQSGMINVDFAHIRRLIMNGGGALMSIGYGQGQDKAHQAVEQALHHPLLDALDMRQAGGVIANFTGGNDLSLMEVQSALSELQASTGNNAEIIPGVINSERMEGKVQVILLVTLGNTPLDEAFPGLSKPAARPQASAPSRSVPAPAMSYSSPAGSASPEAHRRPAYSASAGPATTTVAAEPPQVVSRQPTFTSSNKDLPPFFRYRMNRSSDSQ